MGQDREITREKLHQLLWSKATRTVAGEFGLSDNGLAKIRVNLRWLALVSAGQPVRRPLGWDVERSTDHVGFRPRSM
jgi:hypothetical protein